MTSRHDAARKQRAQEEEDRIRALEAKVVKPEDPPPQKEKQ